METTSDDIMEWSSEATSNEPDTEVLINTIKHATEKNANVIEYALTRTIREYEQQHAFTVRDAINALVQHVGCVINRNV